MAAAAGPPGPEGKSETDSAKAPSSRLTLYMERALADATDLGVPEASMLSSWVMDACMPKGSRGKEEASRKWLSLQGF